MRKRRRIRQTLDAFDRMVPAERREMKIPGLTEGETAKLANEIGKAARAYGTAQVRARRLKAAWKRAEQDVKEKRRALRMLVGARVG